MRLPDGSGSWIATSPAGELRELWTPKGAEKALAAGWRVETAAQYLGRLHAATHVEHKANGWLRNA